jgi:hypothetical protein
MKLQRFNGLPKNVPQTEILTKFYNQFPVWTRAAREGREGPSEPTATKSWPGPSNLFHVKELFGSLRVSERVEPVQQLQRRRGNQKLEIRLEDVPHKFANC